MINLIVVDDDELYQSKIKKVLTELSVKHDYNFEVKYFKGLNKELKEIINSDEERKIYVLDIEIEGTKSGISIAQMIRENDWDSEIIFVTNHDKMFDKVFRTTYDVFGFIEKFDNFEERLSQSIKYIVTNKLDRKTFSYKSKYIDLRLRLKDINYIYRDTIERKIVLCTNNNKYLINKTLSSVIKELDSRFKMVHRACIVNTDKVTKYCWNKGYFILQNGEEVPLLSKNFKKEIK